MSVFETADELYACIGGLFEQLKSQTQVQKELASLNLTVRFNHTEPTSSITLIAYEGKNTIHDREILPICYQAANCAHRLTL